MSDPSQVAVACRLTPESWSCDVVVGRDAAATHHAVTVSRETCDELSSGVEVEALIGASFDFLLEREPRSSILPRFALPEIARYFPEYPDEIRRRLG